MALFKIFKGQDSGQLTNPSADGYRQPTDGYAYYDTGTGLFYIDANYDPEHPNTISRQPINANNAKTSDLSVISMKSIKVPYVSNGTGTAAVTTSGSYYHAKWEATLPGITTLEDGLFFVYKVPVVGQETYGNGLNVNSLGYHPVVSQVTSKTGTRYAVGANILLVYDSSLTGQLYINGTSTNINGCWVVVNDYDSGNTKATQNNTTTSTDYRVLLSGSANDTTTTEEINKNTNLRFNPGAQLLSIGGSISATGDLTVTGVTQLNGQTYADNLTAGSLIVNGNTNFVQIPTAPTPANNSNDTSVATTAFVMNAFTANDAMIFKGVVNANGDLPATHKQGWTYRVATAGTYAGKVCEVGDIIICVTDGTAATDAHWVVIQNNVDGAVYRGTNSFIDANIIIADSTAGKVKSSGKTITNTAPSASSTSATIPSSTAVWAAISGASGYGKTGTVTSVQVQASSPLQSSVSSVQSTSLSTTISFTNQSANKVLAGPSSGTNTAAPTFRSLVTADIPDLSGSYLPLTGGTMTGGVTFTGNESSAWNNKGIIFNHGSRIGENSSGQLGLYSANKFYLRPNSTTASSGKGIEMDNTFLIPTVNNEMSLGDSTHKWSNVYATKFLGAFDGTLSPTSAALANGDRLAFIDSSNSNKVTPSTITFDGTTTSAVLSKKGDWVNLPTVSSLGLDNLYKAIQTAVTTATDNNTTNTRFVSSITQDTNGVITVITELCPTVEVVRLI